MITAENVKHLFDYDLVELRWKNPAGRWNRIPAGTIAGSINCDGYREVRYRGKRYKSHRLIWLWMKGQWPSSDIDHIDGFRANNRWENLREATNSQNQMNSKTYSMSGLKGVTRVGNKFRARIMLNGRERYLGIFSSKEEAHQAYTNAARRLFGEFARLK